MDQKCESLRQEFLRILQEIEKVEKSQDIPEKTYEPNKYESCVKIKGKPILPPLMTETKREECQHWKKRAIEIENQKKAEIMAKPRQRRDSYTLEEPSPVLLAHMQRFGTVEPEPQVENEVEIIGAASKIAQNQEELEQKLENRNTSRLNQYATNMQQSVSRMEQSVSRIRQSAAEVTNESGASIIAQNTTDEAEFQNADCILENYLTDIFVISKCINNCKRNK